MILGNCNGALYIYIWNIFSFIFLPKVLGSLFILMHHHCHMLYTLRTKGKERISEYKLYKSLWNQDIKSTKNNTNTRKENGKGEFWAKFFSWLSFLSQMTLGFFFFLINIIVCLCENEIVPNSSTLFGGKNHSHDDYFCHWTLSFIMDKV